MAYHETNLNIYQAIKATIKTNIQIINDIVPYYIETECTTQTTHTTLDEYTTRNTDDKYNTSDKQ